MKTYLYFDYHKPHTSYTTITIGYGEIYKGKLEHYIWDGKERLYASHPNSCKDFDSCSICQANKNENPLTFLDTTDLNTIAIIRSNINNWIKQGSIPGKDHKPNTVKFWRHLKKLMGDTMHIEISTVGDDEAANNYDHSVLDTYYEQLGMQI